MAVFGQTTGPEAGCRQALMSAGVIDLVLKRARDIPPLDRIRFEKR
jgi:hypothetical protein